MAMITSCTGKNANSALEAFGLRSGHDSDAAPAIKPLDTRLVNAHATDRIALPGMDDKQPAKGNHFVVLEVAVRNTDTQPRVFSEGQIIAVDASRERTFPAPVNIFADGYLQLQVLPPSTSARGRIVYEVPDDASGVLYWVPGGDTRRILLHPDVMAVATSPATKPPPTPAPTTPVAVQPSHAAAIAAQTATSIATTTPPTARAQPSDAVPTPADRASRPAQGSVTSAPATESSGQVRMGSEQARELACSALVSRNDPREKARYLGFFQRECGAYEMPAAWTRARAHVARAAPAPDPNRWPPRPGPAFDCEQALAPAEQLICQDAVLSLMDWELTRAYANAQRSVDDPAALQREQDDWRWHVRNACRTVSCIEAVYTERTADLAALARPQ